MINCTWYSRKPGGQNVGGEQISTGGGPGINILIGN